MLGGGAGECAEGGVEGFVDGVAATTATEGGVGEVVGDELTDGGVGGPAFELGINLVEEGAAVAVGGGEGGAVAEETFDFEDVMTGAAVDKGVGATGVVADHATDAATVAGGGFGTEEEAVGFEEEVEFVADDTGFNPDPAFMRVDLEDVVEMAADVDDDAVADYLAGDAGATGTGDEVGALATRFGYELLKVGFVGRIGYCLGNFAVGGGVGSIGKEMEEVGVEGHGWQGLIV